MEDLSKKVVVNMAEGQDRAEVIIREGAAAEVLDPKEPVRLVVNGTIGNVVEYLEKRIGAGQFDEKDCNIVVDRDNVSIKLTTNETDYRRQSEITGELKYNPSYVAFGINTGKVWTPTELGMFFKMNRAFFADRKTNMDLVTALMNFTANVNHTIERSIKENGNRTDNFAQVVNSNLPEAFELNIPIFKGMPAERLEVETFAKVDGRDVALVLLSPGSRETLEDLRDRVIDDQLSRIREIAPKIAIFEV